MSISIIIINYNQLQLLENCLKSIFKYSIGISFEIIVVDNASTEGDAELITSKFANVILHKNDSNIGFAAANNVGLNHANGDYILFLNNDTVFQENSLKIIYDFVESLNEDVFVGCKLLNADGSHQISLVDFDSVTNSLGENFFLYRLFPKSKLFNRFHMNYKSFDAPIEVDVIKGAFMFCSANAIKKLNGFDTKFFFYAEETDLCHRFKKIGGKIFYYPFTSIYHLGGATTDNYLWFKFKNQSIAKIQIYQKHYRGIEAFLIKVFHFCGIFIRIPIYLLAGIFRFNKSLLKKSYFYFKQLFIYPKNLFKYS